MPFITIKNDLLEIKINTFGAELSSVIDEYGEEHIWQGDPLIWEDRAPVLFPITCNLAEEKYTLFGKEYPMMPHGFARKSEFALESLEKNGVTLLLESNEETLKSYPFHFSFRVRYTLTDRRLDVDFMTKNNSQETMYYSTGAHEGHKIRGEIENYSLIFDREETVSRYEILPSGEMSEIPVPFLNNEREVRLCEDYFAVDAIILFDHKSRAVTLRDHRNGGETRVEFPGFDTLLVWRMPHAQFLCIEPWAGAPEKPWCNSSELPEKFRIRRLEKGAVENFRHSILF